ncbi:MAG: Dabb family protein [Planctomycetota bacterium]
MPDATQPSPEDRPLAHSVYFRLNEDASPEELIAACRDYLTGHPGTLHFSVGQRAEQYQRAVNDEGFDVALVLVFESDRAHDAYQASDRHKQFLAEQLPNCMQVRVFDSYG